MNVLISVDMEGVAGVVAEKHIFSGEEDYERFRKLMTAEANAAIEGALAGGATRIVVNDSHGGMTNLLSEELNSKAELISGSPKPFGMMEGIGPEVDGVFFIGYHAAAGTTEAVLAHTWSGALVAGLWLNGREVGEVGLNAALAGAYGVSVVLVAGDRAVTEEARDLLGAIETVAVKEGVTRTAALCLHPEVAQERIAQAAERALRCEVDPFVLSPPITLRLACRRSGQADRAALMPGSERVGARSVEWTGEDMPTIYKAFQALTAVASG